MDFLKAGASTIQPCNFSHNLFFDIFEILHVMSKINEMRGETIGNHYKIVTKQA